MSKKYEILRSYKWRHNPSLVVSKFQHIAWKSKPPQANVWFLVYYHHSGHYNIEVRTWHNDEGYTLKKFVGMIHDAFINFMEDRFQRERQLTYKHKEAIHLVAIEPVIPHKHVTLTKPKRPKTNAPIQRRFFVNPPKE